MDPEDVSMLWQAVTPLEARDILVGMRIADHPWAKESEKKSFHSKTIEAAYPFSQSRAMTWEDLAKSIGQQRSAIRG